jgi:hypothetical protein
MEVVGAATVAAGVVTAAGAGVEAEVTGAAAIDWRDESPSLDWVRRGPRRGARRLVSAPGPSRGLKDKTNLRSEVYYARKLRTKKHRKISQNS